MRGRVRTLSARIQNRRDALFLVVQEVVPTQCLLSFRKDGPVLELELMRALFTYIMLMGFMYSDRCTGCGEPATPGRVGS